MTFQPPPPPQGPPQGPPPQGPPPQGPPPPQGLPPQGPPAGGPPGNWGPPGGAGRGSGGFGGLGGGMGSFDPKTVNQLDWGILAAGVLTFIFSFFDWYSYSDNSESISDSAWHGFFGWFAVLLALVGSVAVALELFAPNVKLPVPARLIGLGAYALSALCMILAIFIVPSTVCVGGYCGTVPDSVDKGHSFGFWIALILVLAGLVLSFMRFQQTGGQLPIGNRPGGTGTAGHSGPGAPGTPGAPGGYPQQPPGQGYGPQG